MGIPAKIPAAPYLGHKYLIFSQIASAKRCSILPERESAQELVTPSERNYFSRSMTLS